MKNSKISKISEKKSKNKISFNLQVFLALLSIVFIMGAIFSPYGFYTNIHSVRNSIDKKLETAVFGVSEIMPKNYLEKLQNGQISKQEYNILQNKIIDYSKKIDVTYLYALIEKDGKYFYILDQEENPFTEYEEPSGDTIRAFKTKQRISAQEEDAEYGITARTILIPFYTKDNQLYFIGADVNVDEISPLIIASIKHFLLIFSLGVFLVLIITKMMSKNIAIPIKKLSEFTKTLANSNFSNELSIEDDLPKKMQKTNEIVTLAGNITNMQIKLQEYIKNLETQMQARANAENELKIAGDLQQSFLPSEPILKENLEIRGTMKTAKQAGGDLYDFFEIEGTNKICFAIGDVSGKGMPAALFMSKANTLIRASIKFSKNLSEMVGFINNMLCQGNDACNFITFFIATIDKTTREINFVNCGHNPAFLKKKNNEVKMLEMKANSILAVFEDQKFEEETLQLEEGDLLFCYTDGLNEAIAKDGSFYGEDNAIKELHNYSGDEDKLLNYMMDKVCQFAKDTEQSDDITLLSVLAK